MSDQNHNAQESYNEEQLMLLKKCAEIQIYDEWNFKYRNIEKRFEDEDATKLPYINLRNANLSDLKLSGPKGSIDLSHANLEGADLTRTNLLGAFMMCAHLDHAIMRDTKLSHAFLTRASFCNAELSTANFEGAAITKANFKKAKLSGTKFSAMIFDSNFEGAKMERIIMSGAILGNNNFEGADLREANLEGTEFPEGNNMGQKNNLKGANFTGSTVNSKTIIQNCLIDEKTNFTLVNLDSARVEPSLLPALKTNIRRISWSKYYEKQGRSLWGKIKTTPIRFFWWLSDYGSNTAKIFNVFLGISLSFTLVYLAIAYLNPNPAVLSNLRITGNWWLNVISAFCFAISTMVTLGFGGVNVTIQESAPWGTFFALFFVTLNLMIGYFILAVLVTRLGILFQSLGPEQKIKLEKDEITKGE